MLGFMASPKVKMINVRLTPTVHDAFKIAAELRGASMSSLLHQFVVRTIREEKDMDPAAFNNGSSVTAEQVVMVPLMNGQKEGKRKKVA